MTASLNGDAKSLPIRCVIEVKSDDTASCNNSGSVGQTETEAFAIVPSNSLFKDVVKTVLHKLGYSSQVASTAKGAVQIKRWRALALDQVTDNELVSVEDMLGDLANVATLRIKITSKPRSEDVKDKLLLLLLRQSYEVLTSKGCPIPKDDLEKVAEGREELSAATQTEFYIWYNKHLKAFQDENTEHTAPTNSDTSPVPLNIPAGKTRLRISFSAAEVTRLQNWFDMDHHPSRHAMTQYLTELNNLPSRGAGVKPLDLTNIMYWFKNARAAARRNGRSINSDDLSDDEGVCEKDSCTTTAPPLPNSNAVYVIKDPLVGKNGEPKTTDELTSAGDVGTESDMEEDLSVTDNESELNDEPYQASERNSVSDIVKEENYSSKPESQFGVATSASSPKVSSNFLNSSATRLSGYPFPYGAFPMAYLQSQINPFYKDWTEKVQSVVAQAQANTTAQQSMALIKPETMTPECELSKAERQKRHRAFIDPVSEIPKLEQWFTKDTHPSHYIIEQICDDLNRGEFRSRYPKLSPKNIQLWFKNHRAKVKRMRVGGSGMSFNGMDSTQLKLSPPSSLSLSMMETV